jgi:uncharacterized membrane protein
MEKDTGRVEAFSDGVFAIAITLLILEIRVPEIEGVASNGQLFAALLRAWPSLVAFLFSFFVIPVMWMNHHEFMRWVRTAGDYAVSVALALWSASAGLLLCASLWLVWTRLCYRPDREREPVPARVVV